MSTSTDCAILHNVQSYALLHVFAVSCGQKWKGITQYRVFSSLMRLCCTLNSNLFSSQWLIGAPSSVCFIAVTLYVYGSILHQRGKKSRKSACFSLYNTENAMSSYQKIVFLWVLKHDTPRREEDESEGGSKGEGKRRKTVEGENSVSLSRAYTYACAFQLQCWFFCCHKCHTEMKECWVESAESVEYGGSEYVFLSVLFPKFGGERLKMLKVFVVYAQTTDN